jgi:hypothetical protein
VFLALTGHMADETIAGNGGSVTKDEDLQEVGR